MKQIPVAIVGASGYAGAELLRLLGAHPSAEIVAVTSRAELGRSVDEVYPHLRGRTDLKFVAPDDDALARCEAVFFATPHGASMAQVPALLAAGVRVIDLSADFRLRDVSVWQQAYGQDHVAPELLGEAVYGLPEVNRSQISGARLVACPGCYPTSVQLAFAPLLADGVIDESSLIADCKSGVSGAGRAAKLGSLLCEAGDNFHAYASSGHRHSPEINQGLSDIAGHAVSTVFMPHLVPMIRGIHASCYAKLSAESDLQNLFESRYANEPFVDVMPAGSHPETRSVRGGNMCRIAVTRAGGTVVVFSVIDNLVKGASGQAVQCFNLMYGLPESAGLEVIPLFP